MERSLPAAWLLLGALSICDAGRADDAPFQTGLRVRMTAADGEPANDIPGFGVTAAYALNELWRVAAAVDLNEYDFEEPAKIAGIIQDPTLEPIDTLAEATVVSVWAERSLSDPGSAWLWFAGAGLGASFVDVPDARGPRLGGGTFDIHTEVDTEIVVSVMAGVRRNFGSRWYAEFALRADQHFADWQVVDRVSGARGAIDDYRAFGGHLAFGMRW